MARYLVVADETLGGRELVEEIRERVERGRTQVHVLVPASHAAEEPEAPTGAIAGGTTSTQPAADPGVSGTDPEAARRAAFDRMKEAVARFEELGADADGEVGDPDPRTAVANVLEARGDVDEILVATPPTGLSTWVGLDLASRLERDHGIPVTHVEAPRPGSTE